jgi:hypothetical protein
MVMECAPEFGQVVKLLSQLEDAHEKEKTDILKGIQIKFVKGVRERKESC